MRSFTFGRYELIGRIREGGMGEIYLARCKDPAGHEEEIALKVISSEFRRSQYHTKMFLDEGHITQAIAHPHVVRIHEVGERCSIPFIAMELLSGISLDILFAHLVQRGLRLPPDLVAALVAQACSGLHAAHELRDADGRSRDVVHRDISPHNLFCLPSGVVKVIDFGIALARDRIVDQTAPGLIKGKPAYLSPEQVRSAPIDRRSDVFSIGIVLHEFLTGRRLFRRDTDLATIMAVLSDEAPRLSALRDDIPPLLDQLVASTLAKDPAERPATAAVLASGLQQVIAEAGGRFAKPLAIARELAERGVELVHPLAQPLTEPPDFLVAISNTGTVPLAGSEIRPASGALPAGSPPPPPLPGGGIRPAASNTTGRGATEDSPTAPRPPATPPPPPDPWAGHRVGGRYHLQRRLTPEKTTPGAPTVSYRKRWYLGEESLAGEAPQRRTPSIAAPDIRPSGRLAIALVGQTEDLHALAADSAERFQSFAAHRQRQPSPPDSPLAPVLHHGIAWPGGPSYLVTPYYPRTLRTLGPHLEWRSDVRIFLARTISEALHTAVQTQPGYTHGALEPGNIALVAAHGNPYQVVLLDLNLEVVLGAVPLPELRTLMLDPRGLSNSYLAPERLAGEPPTPAADVFALGVILYELLGGDPRSALRATLATTELPRLPPRPGLPDHVEAAIFAALRRDPERRPTATQLYRWLTNQTEIESREKEAMRLVPPPPGKSYEFKLHDGRSLNITTLVLPAHQPSQPIPLPMSSVPGLLPVPLCISLRASALIVEPDRRAPSAPGGGAAGAGNLRASLYHNAHEPSTRCESYTLIAGARGASFDVGHRRSRVQTIHYSTAPGRRLVDEPQFPVSGLPLELRSPEGAQQLATLHTMEPLTGKIHLACVVTL